MKKHVIRKDNKGFSLVELIVVVAVMAILVGLITPHLLQYVDRAKKVKDIECARVLGTAFERVILTNEDAYDQWYAYLVNGKARTVYYTVTDPDGHTYEIGNMYEFTMDTGLRNSRYGIIRNAHNSSDLNKCTAAIIEELAQNNLYISYRKYGINEFRIAMNLETGRPEVWVCPVPAGTDGEGRSNGWVYLRLWPEADPRYLADWKTNPPVATNAHGPNHQNGRTFDNVY
ncbi:MAG: type II secretion system protein [Lachnospiraceae bacterium]|nr:type II secretion system protein [Lachnospiraceae bacterium]